MKNNNPFVDVDKKIVGDIYTSSETMDNLTILCDEFGSRFAGSAAEAQAAEFMKRKLEEYGFQTVQLEAVKYIGWRRGEASLEIISPIQKKIPCITLPHSPPAVLEGWAVDLGDGIPEDFTSRAEEISGKIVLTTSDTYPGGSKRWVHRNEKFGRSLLAGAKGFIFINHYPGYGPATGGIAPDNAEGGEALIPGFAISMEDGAFIQRLINRQGQVRLRMISNDLIEPVTSWNIIADLRGKKQPENMVILGCHYDGHDISQGAADPASGAVALLEAARVLAQYAADLPITVRFALWGAEEIGLIGSTQYVKRHVDELDNIRFYLNMDMAGAIDPQDIIINEWPELLSSFESWREQMALQFGIGQSLNAHSDHFPFMLAGVPTGGIERLKRPSGGRGYGHTMHDTLDKVGIKGLREAAALSARLALRMASQENWPALRRSPAEVAEILDTPDYREEAQLFHRVDELYKQNQTK